LPLTRIDSYIGGSDWGDAPAPAIYDALRIYNYAMPAAGVQTLSAMYNPPPATASLCIIFYSQPGNPDFPWSSATEMTFTYNPVPVSTQWGTAVSLISGFGTRTYTNRFGTPVVSQLTVAPSGTQSSNNFLYLNSAFPVDPNGLTLTLARPTQLPGAGPSVLYSQINVFNNSFALGEGASSRIDPKGSAFLSNMPGFANITIGASNINALAINYPSCQAPLTFTNGLRQPTQPSASNGAVRFVFSYFISDGQSYSVQANLTITCSSAFATPQDPLGNPYQTIIGITGTRTYTYLPTMTTLYSSVTGLSNSFNPLVSQRFYPYSLLSSSPGVYTTSTAPFVDTDGIGFAISPSAPVNGMPIGSSPSYSAANVFLTTTTTAAVLTDSASVSLPSITLQQQYYTFLF
jgi:hypothetical protein